jgi:uncharacterized protein YceH (UPF0502 family)
MTRPTLDPIEVRVAGVLAEKAMATPDQYPLSLRALTTGCNQKTGRDPVTELSERQVSEALERLQRRRLVGTSSGAGSRVVKYRHLLDHELGVSPRELAVLAVLMLRGAQTPGELRGRTARLVDFESVEMVDEVLWLLGDREEPLAYQLDRMPGQSADRYVHGLSGEPEPSDSEAVGASPLAPAVSSEAAGSGLHGRVEALEAEVERLRAAFERFREQFE